VGMARHRTAHAFAKPTATPTPAMMNTAVERLNRLLISGSPERCIFAAFLQQQP
jgi:hypothetical protein